MQTKKMKVQYSTCARQSKNYYFGSGYIETPKIQMEEKWLVALGFHIGDAIQVAYKKAPSTSRLQLRYNPNPLCSRSHLYNRITNR